MAAGAADPQPITPTPVSSPSPSAHAGRRHVRRSDALVIGLLMISTLVVLVSELLMGVALPTLIVELDITATTGQWLTTGYMLTMALLIPSTGFLIRRFRLRTIYLTSMSVFILGTAVAAIAPAFPVLLAGRIIQAVGSAVFLPLLMTTVMRLVPEARRGRTMALIVVVTAAAPAFGPALSGLILSQFSWRWLFIFVLPVAITGLVLGALKLRNITEPEQVRLDVLSMLLAAVGFGGLVYGLATIGESASGHAPVAPWIPIAVGVAGVAAFAMRQVSLQRTDEALLDLRILTVRSFTVPLLIVLAVSMTMFGSAVIVPLYLGDALGLGALQIGLFLIPGGIIVAVVSEIGGRIYDRVGPVPLVAPGAVIVLLSLWLLTTVDASTSIALFFANYLAMFVGQSLMWSPLTTTALSSLTTNLYPHGSAAVSTIQQLGGAAGSAVMVSAYTFGAGTDTTGGLEAAASASATQAAFISAVAIASVSLALTFLVRRPARAAKAAPLP
ncbi:DHA2 family efflux MFS transporter permease subunit [Nocardiopsis sp. ARC36]